MTAIFFLFWTIRTPTPLVGFRPKENEHAVKILSNSGKTNHPQP